MGLESVDRFIQAKIDLKVQPIHAWCAQYFTTVLVIVYGTGSSIVLYHCSISIWIWIQYINLYVLGVWKGYGIGR